LLLLIDRLNTYLRFSIVYTDSDQTLLWQVARDMMNGVFHGPCFYGQNFNPNFEPLFALPFLFAGMDYRSALPLATIIMSILPFIFLSIYFYKNEGPLFGLLPLITALLMSPEYSMLASIPRGFVAGIFFAVIGLCSAFHRSLFSKWIGGFCLGVGIYANPNCILLFPLLIPLFLKSKKELTVLLKTLFPGLLLGLALIFINGEYYRIHKELVIVGPPKLDIGFTYFMSVISRLDSYFNFVAPVFWRVGWISLLLFVAAGVILWKRKFRKESVTIFVLFTMILFSFFVHKVADGTFSVFFSGARMFLAYPFIVLFIAFYYLRLVSDSARRKIFYILITLSVFSFSLKLIFFDYFLQNELKEGKNKIVQVISVDELKAECRDMIRFGDDHVDLVIANSGDTPDQPVTYGCPCLIENFPPTVQPLYERRNWLMPGMMNRTYQRIIIHGRNKKSWKMMKQDGLNILHADKNKGWILIENKIKTRDLLEKTGIISPIL
jgi:hypothetical protein